MAEHDAFGRKIGEDPLANLGWSQSEPAERAEAPAEAATDRSQIPVAQQWQIRQPTAVPAAGRPPRRKRRSGCVIALTVATVFTALLVFAIAAFVSEVSETVDDAVDSVTTVTPNRPGAAGDGEEPGDPPAKPKPPRGLRRGSMIRAENLGPAIRRLRREGGRLDYIRLSADRIDARLVAGRRLKHVSISSTGEFSKFTSDASGQEGTVPWSSLRLGAPERMLRAAARQLRRSPDRIDYLLFAFLDTPAWGAYFKGGAFFRGDATGRVLERAS